MGDPVTRSSDFALPNFNSPLVEYEVVLQKLAVNKLVPLSTPNHRQHQAQRQSSSQASVSSASPLDREAHLGEQHQKSNVSKAAQSKKAKASLQSRRFGFSACASTTLLTPELSVGYSRDQHLTGSTHNNAIKRRADSDGDEGQKEYARVIKPRVHISWPLNRLSNGSLDPFSSLPVWEPRFEMRVNKLLHLYLDGSILSDMRYPQAAVIQRSVVSIRREDSFAQMMKSSAAFNALIAYIETSPDPLVQTCNWDSARWHIGQALVITRSQLANPQLKDSDSIIVTVLLLMLIAVRMNDENTFHAHASGLQIVTNRRRIDRLSNPCPTPGPPHPSFSQPSWRDEMSPNAFKGTFPEPRIPCANSAYKQSAFSEMVGKGIVTPHFAKTQHYCIIINQIAAYARFDWILALMASQHIWTDGGEPKWPPLESACQKALRLCMHLNVWPVTSKPCLISLNQAAAMRQYLKQINLDMLFFQCPNVLVWIALVCGPLAIGYARRWWAWVLQKAQALSNLKTLKCAIELFEEQYAWSPAGTLAAEVFWVATVFPKAFRSPPETNRELRHWSLAKQLRDEAKVEPLMYTKAPWTREPTMQDVIDAEDSLMATVANSAVCRTDAGGNESWTVWIPPSPPCVLNRLCPAHGVPKRMGGG